MTKKEQTNLGAAWQFQTDKTQNWAYMDGAFTPEECAQIIEIGNTRLETAELVGGKVNEDIRESQIAWLYATDLEFAFRRVTDIVTNLNDQFFNFDLFGMAEGFQFTRYDAPAGHYGMHIDKTLNGTVRKLSLTIQLSDPADYEGGELAFQFSEEQELLPKEQGKLIAFPSYVLHEVKPVTKGTRYSLVAWITGKPFK
jgi:PKHD-type hydroxylase